jgi:hypothetical protein
MYAKVSRLDEPRFDFSWKVMVKRKCVEEELDSVNALTSPETSLI